MNTVIVNYIKMNKKIIRITLTDIRGLYKKKVTITSREHITMT